jgi:hypothetical protein
MPYSFWRRFAKHLIQIIFDLVLVGNQQITVDTVTTGVIEDDRIMWINVNSEGNFLLPGLTFTLWATGKSGIRIWIQEEVVERG